jgi:hypothetical protein
LPASQKILSTVRDWPVPGTPASGYGSTGGLPQVPFRLAGDIGNGIDGYEFMHPVIFPQLLMTVFW